MESDISPTERALMTMVCYQQINASFGAKLQARLEAMFRQGIVPTVDELRGKGFSVRKSETIIGIFAFFAKNKYTPGKLSTNEVIGLLTQMKGVGDWTVKTYLLLYEKRPDIVLYEDLDVRKGLRITYKLEKVPTPKQAKDLCKNWQADMSSTLSLFYLDLGKNYK